MKITQIIWERLNMSKNTQSRKYQITINNPQEKGLSHEIIEKKLQEFKALRYYCLSDEVGNESHTYHTHIFVSFNNPKLFSTIKNKFPEAHIESALGTHSQNRDYVFKSGKYKNTEKAETSIPGTQKEWGELPEERQCPSPELAILYELIKQGKSNFEIIDEYPEYMLDISHIDRCRLILRQEQYKNVWRDLSTTYIYGTTGAGKSRYVMDKYGYENVFRVTDYLHPFDTYQGEDILVLEEFNSSFIKIQDALNYLDGYPLKLPCRYSDKIACYTKVYIISNISLEKQYPNIKEENRSTWNAFIRRINKVIWYPSENNPIIYNSTEEYFHRNSANFTTEYMNF